MRALQLSLHASIAPDMWVTFYEKKSRRKIDLTSATDRRYDPDPKNDDGQRVATLPAEH